MTIHEQLRRTREALECVSEEARSEAELILAHAYGISKGALIMRFFDEAEHTDEIARIIRQRLGGAPLAYILHGRNFYGRDFYVDERVLIPRFDTESVAETAIRKIRESGYETIADICCGSGCLGITILLEAQPRHVLFGDVSRPALQVAQLNQERLAPGRQVCFRQSDLLEAIETPVDMIVVNPPYIPEGEFVSLQRQVRDFEPRLALVGGSDGLDYYRRLALEAPEKLNADGMLVCEVGDGQADACREILTAAGWADVEVGNDLAGRARWITGRCK